MFTWSSKQTLILWSFSKPGTSYLSMHQFPLFSGPGVQIVVLPCSRFLPGARKFCTQEAVRCTTGPERIAHRKRTWVQTPHKLHMERTLEYTSTQVLHIGSCALHYWPTEDCTQKMYLSTGTAQIAHGTYTWVHKHAISAHRKLCANSTGPQRIAHRLFHKDNFAQYANAEHCTQ